MAFGLRGRLLLTTLCHAIFSQYGEIMAACLNLMNVPIKRFFRQSLRDHYRVEDESEFETIFSACAAVMFIGLMLAFAIMGKLMDGIGRKETVLLRSFLGIVGSICMLTSKLLNRCELFVVGHLIAGILSGLRVVLVIWMAECSPPPKRGFTSLLINSGGVLAVLLVTPLCLPDLFGTDELWFLLPCITALLATVHLVLTTFLPKSPKQLYMKENDEEAARRAFDFYYGKDTCEIENSISEMNFELKQTNGESSTIVDVIQDHTHRFAFFLVLICSFIPVFSALNIKSQYLLDILMSYGLSQSESTLAMMLISAASLPVSFVAPQLVASRGKRIVFVALTALCAFEWLGFALAELLKDFAAPTPFQWIIASISAILGQSALNMGMLVMAPIMISELCPHTIRATVSQFTQVPPIGIAVLEVFMFPTLRDHFGPSMFVFLAACCAALAAILHTQMLECDGLSMEEISIRIDLTRKTDKSEKSPGWTQYGSTDQLLKKADSQQELVI